MLILTRRPKESLRIGDDVTITILALKHNQVRVGIEAPKTVTVHREEVYERIRAERSVQASDDLPCEGVAVAAKAGGI